MHWIHTYAVTRCDKFGSFCTHIAYTWALAGMVAGTDEITVYYSTSAHHTIVN